jgi:hypothetical protein
LRLYCHALTELVPCWSYFHVGCLRGRSSLDTLTDNVGGTPPFGGTMSAGRATAATTGRTDAAGGIAAIGGIASTSPLHAEASIAAGFYDTCAVTSGSTIQCWGDKFGELGDGSSTSLVPLMVSDITTALDVSVGWRHTCAAARLRAGETMMLATRCVLFNCLGYSAHNVCSCLTLVARRSIFETSLTRLT